MSGRYTNDEVRGVLIAELKARGVTRNALGPRIGVRVTSVYAALEVGHDRRISFTFVDQVLQCLERDFHWLEKQIQKAKSWPKTQKSSGANTRGTPGGAARKSATDARTATPKSKRAGIV